MVPSWWWFCQQRKSQRVFFIYNMIVYVQSEQERSEQTTLRYSSVEGEVGLQIQTVEGLFVRKSNI